MTDHREDKITVLTIRVWKEPGVPGWRARVSSLPDAGKRATNAKVVSSLDDVLQTVREWVQEFLDANC